MSAIVCRPKVGDSCPHVHAVKIGSEPVTHDVYRPEVPRCVAIERPQAVSPVCNLVWTHHSYRCVTVIASVISSVGQAVLAESVGVAVMVNPALRISAV